MSDPGGFLKSIMTSVPASVWVVIMSQFAALIFWAIRIDNKVNDNEKQIAQITAHDTVPGRLLKERVNLLEDRQRYLVNYALFLREELSHSLPSTRQAPPLVPTNPPGQQQAPPRGPPTEE